MESCGGGEVGDDGVSGGGVEGRLFILEIGQGEIMLERVMLVEKVEQVACGAGKV